jgi:hypothetical protein
MFKEWFVDLRERRRLKAALAAEIRAVLIKLGDLTKVQERLVNDMTKSGLIGQVLVQFRGNYNVIFATNAGKLGLLPSSIVEALVNFHYEIQHALESLEMASKEEAPAEFHLELLRVLRNARELGCDLVNELEPAGR